MRPSTGVIRVVRVSVEIGRPPDPDGPGWNVRLDCDGDDGPVVRYSDLCPTPLDVPIVRVHGGTYE